MKKIEFDSDQAQIFYKAEPDWPTLGKKLLKKMKDVKAGMTQMTSDQLKEIKQHSESNDE